ncbi:spore-associated protein A [Streptomyces turgidiscabies]|uniref:Spore-associated protein A n=1 Tax=Streptomyces turgidiscabies TaxID=85558 RepID=A0ABU0RDM8_9ACTN|nr:spore-associated protein A [Streptomyces turgidiscabies]MDQ0930102.1 hypothetical protein [Streptomyces turgidiscabies]
MKLSRRRSTTTAALASVTALAALGGLFATAAPASAASNSRAETLCGPGYKTVATTAVGSVGRIYVTWSEAEGKTCAVTLRNSTGPRTQIRIELNVIADHETTSVQDADRYLSYAGPVYYPSRGYCVQWFGAINGVEGSGTGVCN